MLEIVLVWGALIAVSGAIGWVVWYWMHTWPIHAWSSDPHAFRRLLWRRLTTRE